MKQIMHQHIGTHILNGKFVPQGKAHPVACFHKNLATMQAHDFTVNMDTTLTDREKRLLLHSTMLSEQCRQSIAIVKDMDKMTTIKNMDYPYRMIVTLP